MTTSDRLAVGLFGGVVLLVVAWGLLGPWAIRQTAPLGVGYVICGALVAFLLPLEAAWFLNRLARRPRRPRPVNLTDRREKAAPEVGPKRAYRMIRRPDGSWVRQE